MSQENMLEDDVEALLEAPYKEMDPAAKPKRKQDEDNKSSKEKQHKKKKHHRHRSRDRKKRSRSQSDRADSKVDERRETRRNKRSPSRERRPSRSRDRRHAREGERTRRSDRDIMKSRESDRHRRHGEGLRDNRDREQRRSRDRERYRNPSPRRVSRPNPASPRRARSPSVDIEERDTRTVICMQLSMKVRNKDLEEFFKSAGKVREAKLIIDPKTKRSKGIAYVEFTSVDSIEEALLLNGSKLLGVPIIVQRSQAEKNRASNSLFNFQNVAASKMGGPMKLFIQNLHPNVNETVIQNLFSPFGPIDSIKIETDEANRSKGYGYVKFSDVADARKAKENLTGTPLVDRDLKISFISDHTSLGEQLSIFDNDEIEREGINLGATGRLQLMAKLSQGTGLKVPEMKSTNQNLHYAQQTVDTQCFLLSNMFDPATETESNWALKIYLDVAQRCKNNGGAYHIYVDNASPQGNVYVKAANRNAAGATVAQLHGQLIAGRVVTASYVLLENYHQLFPEAIYSSIIL